MAKYQVFQPIKTESGVVTEGYVEIPDSEVSELRELGVIGDPDPSGEVVKSK